MGPRAHQPKASRWSASACARTSPAPTRSRRQSTRSTRTRRPTSRPTGRRSSRSTTSSTRSARLPWSRSTGAVAVAEVYGPTAALELLDDLDLDRYQRYHAIRADLLRRLDRTVEAKDAYRAAIEARPTTPPSAASSNAGSARSPRNRPTRNRGLWRPPTAAQRGTREPTIIGPGRRFSFGTASSSGAVARAYLPRQAVNESARRWLAPRPRSATRLRTLKARRRSASGRNHRDRCPGGPRPVGALSGARAPPAASHLLWVEAPPSSSRTIRLPTSRRTRAGAWTPAAGPAKASPRLVDRAFPAGKQVDDVAPWGSASSPARRHRRYRKGRVRSAATAERHTPACET